MVNKGHLALIKRRFKLLVTKPWLIPDVVLAYLSVRLARCFHLHIDSFGWLQAVLYSWRIDQWQRYTAVAKQITALNNETISILDIGGSDGTIKEFLNPGRYNLNVLDIDGEALKGVGDSRVAAITGDGCYLPFKDKSFDVVISVDSLEHVPGANRIDYCREMNRVARICVIIHCPVDSFDGNFQGTIYDTKFSQWYGRRFKRDILSTIEHLESGLPKVEELLQLFPGATITGKQNVEVWLKYMVNEYIPYKRHVNFLTYKLRLQSQDDLPPYHACLLVSRKVNDQIE